MKTAFLHGDETIYIREPDQFKVCEDGETLQHPKGLYGLKRDLGYGNRGKRNLGYHFEVKDIGALSMFLGDQFVRKGSRMCLSQIQYINKVLENFDLDNYRSVSAPIAEREGRDVVDIGGDMFDCTTYRELVGYLLFVATLIRSDIPVAVVILSQSAAYPHS